MNTVSPRAPRVLRTIAVIGVVVAIIGTIVIWTFLGNLEETTDRSLLIGEQVTVTLTETIDVADQVLAAIDDGLVTIESTLTTVDEVLQSTAGLAEATGSLAATLPTSFDGIDAALATVQQLGETVDSTLQALSSIPFGPDYDPETPFPEAVADLRAVLQPIGDDLAQISSELQNFADGSGQMTSEIDALVSDLQNTREALSGIDGLLDQYRDATADAAELAAETRGNLETSMTLMRVVLVALGLLLVLSQFVPWTLADALDRRESEADDAVGDRAGPDPDPNPSLPPAADPS